MSFLEVVYSRIVHPYWRIYSVICCRRLMTLPNLLQWHHNGRDSVSNHQPQGCLLNRLFRRRSKKTLKLRVTGLRAENSPETGEFPAQMASNAENVSIWWRHNDWLGTVIWFLMIIIRQGLSEILFSFMIEKYIFRDACGLRFPSLESGSVLYITPTYTSSMQELIMQGMQQKWKSPAFDARRTLGMSNLIIFTASKICDYCC